MGEPVAIELTKLLSGGFAAATAIAGGVWALMRYKVSFWKDAYEAKLKELTTDRDERVKEVAAIKQDHARELAVAKEELASVLKNPTAAALKAFEASQKVTGEIIVQLTVELTDLKKSAEVKDLQIQQLKQQASLDYDELTMATNERDALQEKVALYESAMNEYREREARARMAAEAIRKDGFLTNDGREVILSRLKDRAFTIDQSAGRFKSRVIRNRKAAKEGRAAQAMIQIMKERDELEERSADRAKLRLPLPGEVTNSEVK